MLNDNAHQEQAPGPSTPPPPEPPLPPIHLSTIRDVLKIVIFVTVWYIAADANRALIAAVDYAKLAGASGIGGDISLLPGVTWLGARIGLLQGLIMSAQALVTIWAGPTVFTYLGPVLTAAFKTPIALIAELRRAWSAKADDKKGGSEDSAN